MALTSCNAAHDQAQNSADLVSSTGENSIVSILEELDQQSDSICLNEILCNGPFHVFQHEEVQPTQLDTLSEILGPGYWDTSIADIDHLVLAHDSSLQLANLDNPELINFDAELLTSSRDLSAFSALAFSGANTPAPPISLSVSCGESPADLIDFTLSTAKMLLGHYRDTMVSFFTPARVAAQSPWETMYIPSVFCTVGEIQLSGTSSNAKLSLLFAIFAVVSGNMKHAAYYLRDIEEIINLYGMRKVARSSKVRMLHGIYLYLRVLTERACADDQRPNAGVGDRHIALSGEASYPQLAKWDQILGFTSSGSHSDLSAIHNIPSHLPYKSAFEEIYSVPQSLFKLILQTTQLMRRVQKMQNFGRSMATDHDALAVTVKELETNICDWESQTRDDIESHRAASTPQKEEFPYHLVQAVQKALLIYFYRCIRDVNPATLQLYVQQTIYHLLEYDKQKKNHKDQSANTCWPGFIAGCEAQDPHLRDEIANWLDRSGQSTGIRMFTVAREAIQKVWQARSCPGMESVPWNQVLDKYSDLRVLVLS
ncbi:uncharacterized protein N7511_004796 [Penicillium nucicola]|uniref:uncharacterized protein n=1 Tax=Penicillium nucicola TaxID=1850975 RepID=UPI002544F7F5|nr:uncharacterized protein N7511_004796 [Penicillium nucicola]KAJ5767180.1 hypothetical protein N7511_004796 [Penicillium nucicola]